MRQGWNFHNDIAICLEGDTRHYFEDIDRPVMKIYDADSNEICNFVEVMIILLCEKTGLNNEH